jgi:hypothetical protein
MANDKLDLLGPVLSQVGGALARIAEGDPGGVFLYVEVGEGWISPNIFKEEAEQVRWLEPDDKELIDLLFEAWYLDPKDKRWSVMEYVMKEGKFEVSFKYPEEINVELRDHDHREDALIARYGDKPRVYPPPEGMFELKP